MTERKTQRDAHRSAKAQYLVLRCLEKEGGELEYERLKELVRETSEALDKNGSNAPIHFVPSNRPDGYKSRSFVRALSLCYDTDTVIEERGFVSLTDAGERFISNIGHYPVPDAFKESVNSLLTPDGKLQLASD